MTALSFSRNRTADLLKGVAVILMVQVHLMELFARQEIYDSMIGKVSLFLGGIPAAPVFMMVMGYYIAKSKKNFFQSLLRGLKIILLGFALNIGLNFHLLYKIYTGILIIDPMHYIFGVDILFLAGLSIIGLSLLKLIRAYRLHLYLFALIALFILQIILKNTLSGASDNYLLAYFFGEGIWWSYFPFIPWFAYPLAGFLYEKLDNNFGLVIMENLLYFLIGGFIVMAIFIEYGIKISANLALYYNHNYLFFIYASFFLMAWSVSAFFITRKFTNTAVHYIEWLGKNVTAAYVIQWLIIGNIATALYKTQSLIAIVFWFIFIMVLTSGGVWLWVNRKRFKTDKQF